MKVMVTGAGGYIGSVFVPLLLEKGFEVTAVDRFFFGKETLPPKSKTLKIIEDDIRSIGASNFEKIEAVIDLAAISNDPSGELDQTKTLAINHLGRLRIATLAKLSGAKRYILPSSCSIYGFQEEAVDESSAINPLTTYAKANYKAECDILKLADNNFCATVIRQATVYGSSPRMRFDLAINGMVKGFFANKKIPILRDGNQWRPFVHVKDTCKAMATLLETDKSKINKEVFNVGSNEQNYQIFNLAEQVADAIGIPFEYEWYGDADRRSYRVKFGKIKTAIGFKPDYDAKKGAKEVWDGINNGALNPNDPRTITIEWYKKLIAEGVQI